MLYFSLEGDTGLISYPSPTCDQKPGLLFNFSYGSTKLKHLRHNHCKSGLFILERRNEIFSDT